MRAYFWSMTTWNFFTDDPNKCMHPFGAVHQGGSMLTGALPLAQFWSAVTSDTIIHLKQTACDNVQHASEHGRLNDRWIPSSAALEAIAMRSREIILAMQKDAGIEYKGLKVDGGASENNLLMQIQANLLNTKVIRPITTETTALGVAFLAGLASGFWRSPEELINLWEQDKTFIPRENTQASNIISLWEERIQKIITNGS